MKSGITKKYSSIILVVGNNKLLVQSMEHQEVEIVDVFGVSITPEARNDEAEQVAAKINEKIDASFAAKPFGKIVAHIQKPEENVELTTSAYRVSLSDEQWQGYELKENQFWADFVTLRDDSRIRFGDRLIFMRALDDRPLDIELSEEQFGLWVNAKLIGWSDK